MSPGLQGKTYLVTGCTDGIGENTVHKLAAAGASILLHGRQAIFQSCALPPLLGKQVPQRTVANAW